MFKKYILAIIVHALRKNYTITRNTMILQALNPINQPLVTEADKHLTKWFLLNDLQNIAIESNNIEEAEKLDLLALESFEMFCLACQQLPLDEVERLERFIYY